MNDDEKTKERLIEELEEARLQIEVLQATEASCKQTEEALRKSDEEMQDVYNNAPCGYQSLDKDGAFVNINNTELSWLGYTRDEIIGKNFSEIITPESLKIFKEIFPRFKERGWVRNLDFELIRKDGSIIPASFAVSPVRRCYSVHNT